MKRDAELIREILLAVESHDHNGGLVPIYDMLEYPNPLIGYHVYIMHNYGLLEALNATTTKGFRYKWIPKCLTMEGHDYIETVRDPENWRKTTVALSKIGSWDLDTIKIVAKKFLSTKIEQLFDGAVTY